MDFKWLARLRAWGLAVAALGFASFAGAAPCPDNAGSFHTKGDLTTRITPDGKVTRYTHYTRSGLLLRSVDPDCVVTLNTYDLRDRLLSHTVGPYTTRFTYDAAGQLLRITLPDESWMGFESDDAHRLVAELDNTGSRVDYKLDNAGNRIGERVSGPDGSVKRTRVRAMDALGRAQRSVRPAP